MQDYQGREISVGDRVYVDLGDSVTDGGEFTGEVAEVSERGLRTVRGDFVSAARLETVFIEVEG